MNGITFAFPWEIDYIICLQSICNPIIQKLAIFLSMLGEETFLIIILGYFYWCKDKRLGKIIGLNLITVMLSAGMIKNLILRRRPYFDFKEIKCLNAPHGSGDIYDISIQGYSFPSMHSANSVSILFPIAEWAKKNWQKALCIVLPLFIGLSRNILGAHYPTDVFIGWVLGLLVFWVVKEIQKRTSNYLLLGGIYAVLALPGWFFCHSTDFYTVYGLLFGMMIGFHVEEKYIQFENTNSVLQSILRLLGGMVLFLGISTLLKLPFPSALREADTVIAHLIRAIRYAISIFVVIGVYPRLFQYMKNI